MKVCMKNKQEKATPKKSLVTKKALPDNITPDVFNSHGLWSRPGFLVRRLNQIHYAMFFEECAESGITPVHSGIAATYLWHYRKRYLAGHPVFYLHGVDP